MDMRIAVSNEQFEHLHGHELGWMLIEPAILQVRGQSPQKKREVYERLTYGQKSLFSFWVLYGHVQSGWLEFYLGGFAQYLPVIGKDLERVKATALLDNLHQAEQLYVGQEALLQYVQGLHEKCEPPNQESKVILEKLRCAFAPVDRALLLLLEETTQQLETYIRAKPEDFVVFTT